MDGRSGAGNIIDDIGQHGGGLVVGQHLRRHETVERRAIGFEGARKTMCHDGDHVLSPGRLAGKADDLAAQCRKAAGYALAGGQVTCGAARVQGRAIRGGVRQSEAGHQQQAGKCKRPHCFFSVATPTTIAVEQV